MLLSLKVDFNETELSLPFFHWLMENVPPWLMMMNLMLISNTKQVYAEIYPDNVATSLRRIDSCTCSQRLNVNIVLIRRLSFCLSGVLTH